MKSDQQFLEMDDGVRLRTWSGGRGAADTPPLVLIHGGPQSGDPTAAWLRRKREWASPDLTGEEQAAGDIDRPGATGAA